MTQTVKRVPEDFHTITPHLVVRDAPQAVDFYCKAFSAVELYRSLAPDGQRVMHCELLLGDSRFLIHDEFPERGLLSPLGLKGTAVTLHLFVEDVDRIFQQAVDAGAETVMPVADCFWGDRYGILLDPFGHKWSVASRIEDLAPVEQQQRGKEFTQKNPDWPSK
jgi:PhnB protein